MTTPSTDTRTRVKQELQRLLAARNLTGLLGTDPAAGLHRALEAVRNATGLVQAAQNLDADPILVQEADEMLEALKQLETGYDVKIAQGEGLSKAITTLTDLEFVKKTASGIANVVEHKTKLTVRVHSLRNDHKKVNHLIADLESAKQTEDAGTRKKALKETNRAARKLLDHFEALSKELADGGADLQHLIEAEAVRAYVQQNPNERRKQVETAFEALEHLVDAGGAVTPPGWGWIPGTIQLLRTIAARGADEALIQQQKGAYNEEHAKGEIYAEHDADPLLIAGMLVDQHKANLKLLLKAVGVAGDSVPGWDPISDGIEILVGHLLDTRIALAKEKLGKADKRESIIEKVLDSVADEIEEQLTVDKLVEVIVDPVGLVKHTAIKAVVAAVAPVLHKAFPPDPAQAVSGDTLKAQILEVLRSQLPAEYFKPGAAQPAVGERKEAVGAPTADGKGRAVEASDGRDGVTVDRPDGSKDYHVAIRAHDNLLWGYLNDRSLEFVAHQPDDSAFSDWSTRTVTLSGYREGGDTVTGQWYRVWADKSYYLLDVGGVHEWARGADHTANGPGAGYNIMAVLDEHVGQTQYPWPL